MGYFSWLHLTDLHRGMKEQHWLWPGVREIFFEDLKRLHDKCGPWDLVLFTGDLTQRGSAQEFQRVNELLEQLWEHFSKLGSSPKLLAVPGNHDLVRPERKDPSVKLLQQWAEQPDIREEFWEDAESPYRQVVTQAFENYTAWWKKQPRKIENFNTGILPGDFSTTIEKEGAKLGIVGFNTSFLQLTGDDYEGKLALHARQFQEACDGDGPTWAKQHHACLLLTHHPPLWLDPNSQQDLNAEISARDRFVVHLCGHLHETAAREISEGGTKARRIWQGRSLFGLEYFGTESENHRLHGYTIGRIELSGDTGTLLFWPREARLQGGQRTIVPDFSLKLTDDQHTPPKDFELLQPYGEKSPSQEQVPEEPGEDLSPTAGTGKPYAVFLIFNSEDREAVEKVAVHLADNARLRPWFDQWGQIPGESRMRNLERGIEQSETCAVFVGKSGEGPWQKPEVEAALRKQIQNPDFRVIPVLLPDAPEQPELPTFLAGNIWVEFRKGLDDDNALWRLECGIRGVSPGRGRPKPEKEEQIPPTTVAESVDVGKVEVKITTAEKPVYVFISYRHQEPDSLLAHAFRDALKQAGHQFFIDTGISWGADWAKEIQEALTKSDYLLLLLSPETAASEMVVEEVMIAKELARQHNGIPAILPVRVQFPFPEPLPYHLSACLRTIHQVVWNGPEDTSPLVNRLLTTIAKQSAWSAEAPKETSNGSIRQTSPLPQVDPRDLIVPGGALEVDSRFYIMREADEEVFTAVNRSRSMVTVRGPRQTGKTSLIVRVHTAVRSMETQLRTAFVDFQVLPHEDFESLNTVWQAVAVHIAEQLGLDNWDPTTWNPDSGYDRNVSRFLDHVVFDRNEGPLLLCFDEVDRVFNFPVKTDFFASIRGFYNRSAYNPSWKKVRWLLATSSEPSFFIEDLTQSPFNIGLRVELNTFTSEEVDRFARRHGLTLESDMILDMMDYIGGRPYLVHLLLYQLVRNPDSRDQLFKTEYASQNMFRDHLNRFLMQFQREKELAEAMKSVIAEKCCDDVRMANRLESAGLVRRDENQKIVPLCRLYAEFFGKEL